MSCCGAPKGRRCGCCDESYQMLADEKRKRNAPNPCIDICQRRHTSRSSLEKRQPKLRPKGLPQVTLDGKLVPSKIEYYEEHPFPEYMPKTNPCGCPPDCGEKKEVVKTKTNPCGCPLDCGKKKEVLISTQCLDGQVARPGKIPARHDRYIYIPPPPDYRQDMDPSFHCYGATMAAKRNGEAADCYRKLGGPRSKQDYCTDSKFVPPEPLASDTWTNDPPGQCSYPRYCLADCFDHCPERDWFNSRPTKDPLS
uniref:Uncharacterized protein n=2 Tax=Clastoptera arizonana TaxID=38151 RepID=A0A1B6D932_9HEMI